MCAWPCRQLTAARAGLCQSWRAFRHANAGYIRGRRPWRGRCGFADYSFRQADGEGGISAEKLDLAIRLADLSFKPWRALVPQLPEGAAELTASLEGTPTRPAGNFRFGLKEVKVPKSAAGADYHVSCRSHRAGRRQLEGILTAKLELRKKTVQALGGKTADVKARLPLLF